MLISHSTPSNTLCSRLKNGGIRSTGVLIGFFFFNVCLLFLLIVSLFDSPVDRMKSWMEDHGFQEKIQSGRAAFLELPGRLIAYAQHSPEVPHLLLDVKFKHIQKLEKKRKEALAQGILIQGEKDYVPARIRLGNESFKVKLRLKGDWADQFIRDRWSFRVHVKGKEQIFGLRRFSLHHPSARHYHGEPLFLEFVRSEGIATPRYSFVDVTLNGDFIGRMALEEHFSKELLESQGRKESVIIKFDESLLWESNESWEKRGFDGIFDNYANAKIVPFRKSKIDESTVLTKNLETATGLLRGFVNRRLNASQVFDVQLMGKFLAIAHVWGAWHPLRWHNMRFYFNPITTRLEPIAYDSNVWDPFAWDKLINNRDPLTSALLKDPMMWKVYLSTLNRLQEELQSGKRLDWLKSLEKTYRVQLGTYYPLLAEYDLDKLQVRANKLRAAIHNVDGLPASDYPKYLAVSTYTQQGRSYVEMANLTPLPIEVLSIQWTDPNTQSSVPFQTPKSLAFPMPLTQTHQSVVPQFFTVEYMDPLHEHVKELSLTVSYRILGQHLTRIVEASPYFPPLPEQPISVSTLDSVLALHPFLTWNEQNTVLIVRTGVWKVNRPLIFPRNTRVFVEPGTTLQFSPKSFLLARGPIMMNGTVEQPITLEGQTQDQQRGNWQGVVVLQANEASTWTHVKVLDTAGVDQPHWKLTGGVTFYESEIFMKNSYLSGNISEDALNIVRTNFQLTDTKIETAVSDGLDVDFGKGTIIGGAYIGIGFQGGGDAIDVSGSEVSVENVLIRDVTDKGISVGEGSHLTAKNVTIERTGVGAVSKDGSLLKITDSRLVSGKTALMAYTKKPEYGPGKVIGENVVLPTLTNTVRVQNGSSIQLDGELVQTENLDVEELYNTSMKSGRKR